MPWWYIRLQLAEAWGIAPWSARLENPDALKWIWRQLKVWDLREKCRE